MKLKDLKKVIIQKECLIVVPAQDKIYTAEEVFKDNALQDWSVESITPEINLSPKDKENYNHCELEAELIIKIYKR